MFKSSDNLVEGAPLKLRWLELLRDFGQRVSLILSMYGHHVSLFYYRHFYTMK